MRASPEPAEEERLIMLGWLGDGRRMAPVRVTAGAAGSVKSDKRAGIKLLSRD